MASSGFCPNCGAQRVAGATFCPSCGRRYDIPGSATQPAPQTSSSQLPPASTAPTAPTPAPGRRRIPFAELVVIIGIILAVLGGGYLLVRQNVSSILSTVGNSVGPTPTATSATVSAECASQLKGLSDALFELDSRLSVGMNFNDYGQKVADAKVAYDRLKPSGLDSACLATAGAPEENALNDYIDAYNTWNDCVKKTTCKNDSITPSLQAKWSDATDILEKVKDALP